MATKHRKYKSEKTCLNPQKISIECKKDTNTLQNIILRVAKLVPYMFLFWVLERSFFAILTILFDVWKSYRKQWIEPCFNFLISFDILMRDKDHYLFLRKYIFELTLKIELYYDILFAQINRPLGDHIEIWWQEIELNSSLLILMKSKSNLITKKFIALLYQATMRKAKLKRFGFDLSFLFASSWWICFLSIWLRLPLCL